MKRPLISGIWPRLILISVAIAVLGIAPTPHAVRRSLEQASISEQAGAALPAAQAIAQAAHLLPWRADLWERAGRYALEADETELAIEYLTNAWRNDRLYGLSETGWLVLGEAHRRNQDLPNAIAAWSAGMGRYGMSTKALEQIWQAYLALGNLEDAADTLNLLAGHNPQDAKTHYRLGLLLTVLQPEQALQHLDMAARLDYRLGPAAGDIRRALLSARADDHPAYTHTTIGRALAALGEWSLAAESFSRAVALQPSYAEAWAYLGEARQHHTSKTINLPSSADSDGLQELQKALQLDPRSLSAHTFLALYWMRQANYERAEERIRAAILLDPKNPALQVQFADIQASSGDLPGAYQSYLRAIDLSPHDPAYRRYLIEFALKNDFDIEAVALPMARDLAASGADQPENVDLLGQVMLKLGDLDSAVRFFNRALALAPQNAAAHMHLGLVYALRGDHEPARRELGLAISLAGDTAIGIQAQRLMDSYFP